MQIERKEETKKKKGNNKKIQEQGRKPQEETITNAKMECKEERGKTQKIEKI